MLSPIRVRSIVFASCLLAAFFPLSSKAIAQASPSEAEPKRKPAPVMSYRGAGWLERETREEEERPDQVIAFMELKDGQVVADVGCGSGYYTRRMAKAVAPSGKVYAVDIQPEMIQILKHGLETYGVTNVEPILNKPGEVMLPRGEIDWIILADVYHEFQMPEKMLAGMFESLAPGGRIALLEYRDEGDTAQHIKPEHRMTVGQVLTEWNPAGFELIDLQEFLPAQHLFIFGKDPDRMTRMTPETQPSDGK